MAQQRWFVALVGLLAAACSFETRSGEFVCASQTDCASGQRCVDGWCILDMTISECPPDCDSCAAGTCIINCGSNRSCGSGVRCPAGMDCRVSCAGDRSCIGGVDCSDAASCQITCSGDASCSAGVSCGNGPCTVGCSGDESCGAGIDCADACRCSTDCSGGEACLGGRSCPKPSECRSGGECVAEPTGRCDLC
jgi:hypothetical protein